MEKKNWCKVGRYFLTLYFNLPKPSRREILSFCFGSPEVGNSVSKPTSLFTIPFFHLTFPSLATLSSPAFHSPTFYSWTTNHIGSDRIEFELPTWRSRRRAFARRSLWSMGALTFGVARTPIPLPPITSSLWSMGSWEGYCLILSCTVIIISWSWSWSVILISRFW